MFTLAQFEVKQEYFLTDIKLYPDSSLIDFLEFQGKRCV